jgi:hypothetical protein
MIESRFPAGTPIRVKQTICLRGRNAEAETVGTVESWQTLPTASWFAHGKNGKLPLKRLKLKKADGELSLLVVDDQTQIEAVPAPAGD